MERRIGLVVLLVAGALLVNRPALCGVVGLANDAALASGLRAPPAYVMHNVEVLIDTVAAGERSKVGDRDQLRIVYDASAVDQQTRRVPLLNFQHLIGGHYQPEHPDSTNMPLDDAWLDMSGLPYKLHFYARVVHGKSIVIDVSETTGRLTIRSQTEGGEVLLSGRVIVDPTPITGRDADAAATAPAPTATTP